MELNGPTPSERIHAAVVLMIDELLTRYKWRLPQLADALGEKRYTVRRWYVGERPVSSSELLHLATFGEFSLDTVLNLSRSTEDSLQLEPTRLRTELRLALADVFGSAALALAGGSKPGIVGEIAAADRATELLPASALDALEGVARRSLEALRDDVQTARRPGRRSQRDS